MWKLRDKVFIVLVLGTCSTIVLLHHQLYFTSPKDFQVYQRILYNNDEVLKVPIYKASRGHNYEGIDDKLILKVLRTLKEPVVDTDVAHIFKGDLSNKLTWEFDFSEISKRRLGRSYIEQTSYEADSRNGDFYNPVEVGGGGLVLFEDHGPGIFERLLWCHRTNYAKDVDHVVFEIDGNEVVTLPVVTNETYPFLRPFIRTPERDNLGGFYVTFPVPYEKSLRVIMRWNGSSKMIDETIFSEEKKCHEENLHCNVVGYYAAIVNKLVHGTKLKTNFWEMIENSKSAQLKRKYIRAVAAMANSPERYAPGLKSECKLSCQRIQPGEDVLIYSDRTAKVIQSLRFRVYDEHEGKLVVSQNWKRVLITMRWDDKDPQVKEIPLAGLFITGLDFIREVKSLTSGLRNMTCDAKGERWSDVASDDWTAYLFYEMPFWKSAKISVRIPSGLESVLLCFQISTKKLDNENYDRRLTGYFSAQLNQQTLDHVHDKTIFHLENQWGHVVAVNFFLKNEKIDGTHELDVIVETDNASAPIFSGTGLEDFFHYVHEFEKNDNKTAPFNGAPFYFRMGVTRVMRCYRHSIFDPILFTTGIRMYVESHYDRRKIGSRKFSKTASSFNQTILPDSLFTVLLYYGANTSGGAVTDELVYQKVNEGLSSRIHFIPSSVVSFYVRSCFENQPGIFFDRMVVSMSPGQQVVQTFNISANNVGVILRREYRSIVPNQKAEIKVDGEYAGLWFCPQRAISEQLSLRLHDHLLPAEKTAGKVSIEVTLTAVTKWETISIRALSVLLSN